MEKEKNNLAFRSEPNPKPASETAETPKIFSNFENKRKPKENQKKRFSSTSNLKKVILETKRTTKVTKGGRRFRFASAGLVEDENKRLVTFTYTKGKEAPVTFQKMLRRSQRTFAHFSRTTPTPRVFPSSFSTIPHDIKVSYKTVTLLIKPTPPGSGVRAGGVLRKLFKIIGIKDVSAKIINSGSDLNLTRAAFLALSKINWDKNKKVNKIS